MADDATQAEEERRERYLADLRRTRAESEKFEAEARRIMLEAQLVALDEARARAEMTKLEAERLRLEAEARQLGADETKLRAEGALFAAQSRFEPFKIVGLMAVAFFLALGAARAVGWL